MMTHRLNIALVLKTFCLLVTFTGIALGLPAQSKPNLIIILTDDQGYADVGFNGCEDIPTPNIDTIAANGVRFTNGYVTHPVCGPSRAGLLTGRYQGRFGFNTNPSVDPDNPNVGIPHEEKNIAEVLEGVGYTSAIVGKWHMGSHPDHHPLNRGFDYFYGFLTGGHDYFPESLTVPDLHAVKKDWEWYRTRLMEDFERVDADEYLTDELTNAAVAFINRAASEDKPFFLYLAYNAPHTPLQATDEYLARFPHIENEKRKTYAAMVSSVDDGVGRVLDALQQNDITDDTIVFFLSDNGGASKNAANNRPLRGYKSDYFEGGIRVPFAMQWPATVPGGMDYDEPILSLDMLGTIVGITDAQTDPERPLDGVNLIPYLTGDATGVPHEKLFWRNPGTQAMAARVEDMKLVANKNREKQGYRLYNLEADLSEKKDLSKQQLEKADQLKADWEAWNAELQEQTFPALGEKWWRRK